MAQDFAKRKQGPRKKPARKRSAAVQGSKTQAQSSGKGMRVYLAGVLSGIFLSFLFYLGTLPPSGEPPQEHPQATPAEDKTPKPRFDFYTLLPEQKIDVDVEPEPVEPAADVSNPRITSAAKEVYLLQAGSFRQREDADRRRAELLLLGLEPNVEETRGDNGRWFRVYLGPFDTHSAMSRARGLTANQNIDTLVLKRTRP